MSMYIQELIVKAHQQELYAEKHARNLAKLATAQDRPRLRLTSLRALFKQRPAPCEDWQPCADPAIP